jgi:hypothetical protein
MKRIIIFTLCISLTGCGTVKKLLKKEKAGEPAGQQTKIQSSVPKIKPLNPGGRPVVLNTPVQFLPSYRDRGGPHLKIDSLNAVILLNEQTLSDIRRYTQSRSTENSIKSGASESSGQTGIGMPGDLQEDQIVRYYATKYRANDLLGDQIDPERAQSQSHFRGTFDKHRNLLSLEFYGEREADSPAEKKLAFLYASYWDILYNKRVNYIDGYGNRPSPHVKVFTDPAKIVHRIDYLDNNKKVIADGTFIYGVKNMILEQRIEFNGNGKLTELHPDYFYLQFDRIEQDWIIKCLYEDEDLMSDLIVMQDAGNVFYRYHFQYEKVRNQQIIEAFVFSGKNKLVGRYELYFNDRGNLEKKILISPEGKITGFIKYSVDLKKLKMIVDSFDEAGQHLSRIYRDL